MGELDYHFSAGKIIHLLCKFRIKFAKQRHAIQMLNDISTNPAVTKKFQSFVCPRELADLLPPRRQWCRLKPLERKKIKDPYKIAIVQLERTISTTHIRVMNGEIEAPVWYVRLGTFIREIQESLNTSIQIAAPAILAAKKENRKFCKQYRPLASYPLKERIIISSTTKYLTDIFDEYLYDCAYAFRRPNGNGSVSHHSTVDRILAFLKANPGKEIWVAECDIKKFYDCVNHSEIWSIFCNFVDKVKADGKPFDSRAATIFSAYLDSYSFNKNVLPLNANNYFGDQKIRNGQFDWPAKELEVSFYKGSFGSVKIGLPQGGALSCLMANLLLHSADDLVLLQNEISDLLYIRFCDDMVILSTSKQDCSEALDRYLEAINNLKLLAHTPQEVSAYNKHFWEYKSKLPYKWAPARKGGVPWLSFVGYQIRYDGCVRPRKKSVEKERTKQSLKTFQIMRAVNVRDALKLNEYSRKSIRQQVYAVQNRMISMSVGRVKRYDQSGQFLCWANGFRKITNNAAARGQLKMLDRTRNKNLYRLKKQLQDLALPTGKPDDIDFRTTYFGAPYSYFGVLNSARPSPSNPRDRQIVP